MEKDMEKEKSIIKMVNYCMKVIIYLGIVYLIKENKIKESYRQQNNLSPNKTITTNPIDKNSGLVAKINVLGSGMSSTGAPHSIVNHHNEKSYGVIDYYGFIKDVNEIVSNNTELKEYLNAFHNLFINKLNCAYTGMGIINEQSSYINIRLLDKNSNVYSFKIFESDKENEIVKALDNGEISSFPNSAFLKLPSIANLPCTVIPIKLQGKKVCVAITSDYNIQNHLNLYRMAAFNLGMVVQNKLLSEKVAQNSDMDTLTNLYSHRRFHELLSKELTEAETTSSKLSVVIFDINGMGQINKDYGHSKGDEVIKTVANKINSNIKKQDIAARYGGDKIAVILKDMSSDEAKYIAEYLTYSLSCCLVDDIGPVNKVAVGIATYPEDSMDKEKLLILAEKAVLSILDIACVKLIFFPNEIFSQYMNYLDLDKEMLISYSNGYGPYVLPVDFQYITYEMFTDTLNRKTKEKIIETLKTV